MNKEEAIRKVESYLTDYFSNFSIKDYKEIEKIIKALKQEPCEDAKKCHNVNSEYAECDQFVCSNCGIELQDWHRVERDGDDGDITYHEYEFKYCPNCGAKINED